MNETTAKVCEEQVADLTIENAHRVTMIRKKGTDYPPRTVPFQKGASWNGQLCTPVRKSGRSQ